MVVESGGERFEIFGWLGCQIWCSWRIRRHRLLILCNRRRCNDQLEQRGHGDRKQAAAGVNRDHLLPLTYRWREYISL